MNVPIQVNEAELQAYVDRRLVADRHAAVEAWLATHPSEAERLAAYSRINELLRAAYDGVLAAPIPDRLVQRPARKARWRRFAALAASVLVAVILGGIAGWRLHAGPDSALVQRAALAHATYAPEVLHPVELRAQERSELLAWLSKRLGMKVEAPNLEAAGFNFVGGRLLPGEAGASALLMYESSAGARVSLYWAADTRLSQDTGLRYAHERNLRVYYWIDSECGYAVVSSELGKEDLLRVTRIAHDQLEK
jgi:anti-sigma factor RsiW